MARAGLTWSRSPAQMADALDDWYADLVSAVQALGAKYAADAESQMKAGRSWTDRTSVAVTGLFGRAIPQPDGVTIVIGHSATYGIYLELANGGRYAIVVPTLRTMTPIVFAGMQRLVA